MPEPQARLPRLPRLRLLPAGHQVMRQLGLWLAAPIRPSANCFAHSAMMKLLLTNWGLNI